MTPEKCQTTFVISMKIKKNILQLISHIPLRTSEDDAMYR